MTSTAEPDDAMPVSIEVIFRVVTPLDALRAARALLADETRWTRSAPARRLKPAYRGQPADWVRCAPLDDRACRWCAAGALVTASGIVSDPPGLRALEHAAMDRFGVGIGRANDDPQVSHVELLNTFDAAISAVRRAGEG